MQFHTEWYSLFYNNLGGQHCLRCSQTRPLTAEPPLASVGFVPLLSVLGSSLHFTTDLTPRTGVFLERLRSNCPPAGLGALMATTVGYEHRMIRNGGIQVL